MFVNSNGPELDYGYSTAPQVDSYDQELPCVRGKGLGGTSVLNLMSNHVLSERNAVRTRRLDNCRSTSHGQEMAGLMGEGC